MERAGLQGDEALFDEGTLRVDEAGDLRTVLVRATGDGVDVGLVVLADVGVYVQGTAPFSRIQATAQEVSRPPENAMPTRSPTGRLLRTLDTGSIVRGGRAALPSGPTVVENSVRCARPGTAPRSACVPGYRSVCRGMWVADRLSRLVDVWGIRSVATAVVGAAVATAVI